MKKKVIVAMSGGVDSSLTAYLMKEKGYEVIGITLKLFKGQEKYLLDAEKVAKDIGIKWFLADYTEEFNKNIINYFINTYKKGLTPNPCSYCNRHGKFRFLFNELQKYNADIIATGHYARKVIVDGRPFVAKGFDHKKDQSYYLALVESFHLGLVEFPLGGMTKVQTRELAKSYGLAVHDKKDSQEVCFLEGGDYREYLKDKLGSDNFTNGNFVFDGKILGKHKGVELYTVGQRRGLGLGYHEPLYVKQINPLTNEVILCRENEGFVKKIRIKDTNFFTDKKIFKAKGKIRYRMKEANCLVEIHPENSAFLLFDEPQSFPAPGQVAAVYDGELLVGGGFIEKIF